MHHGRISHMTGWIRRLTKDDVDQMRALNALFAAAFDDDPDYTVAPPDDAYLHQTLQRPHVIALVATEGASVIGGLVAYELPKLEQERSEIYIYDLAVASTHRQRGVATALITKTRDIALEIGAWAVFLQADYADAPAVALYTKLGTREEVLHFDIDFDALP